MTYPNQPPPHDAKQHRVRNFLLGLTGTDIRDVESWAEAAVPINGLGMVVVNMLVAFAAWWFAAGTIFPDLGDGLKAVAAAIGALLIGSLDWSVVFSRPSARRRFTSGTPSPSERIGGPSAVRYYASYLVRMLLAGVIALVIAMPLASAQQRGGAGSASPRGDLGHPRRGRQGGPRPA